MKSSTDTCVSSSTVPPPYPTLPGPCESNHTHHHHTITTDEPENDPTMINQDSILRIRRCNTHKCSTTTTKNQPRKQNESSSTTISRPPPPPPPPPMTVVTPTTKNVHRWTSTPLLLKKGQLDTPVSLDHFLEDVPFYCLYDDIKCERPFDDKEQQMHQVSVTPPEQASGISSVWSTISSVSIF